MRTKKFVYVSAPALLLCSLFGCSKETAGATCRIGDEASCLPGFFCDAGEEAQPGDSGRCREVFLPADAEADPVAPKELPPGHDSPRTSRVVCSAQTEGLSQDVVSNPLLLTGDRLLFNTVTSLCSSIANNSLYAFDTTTCTLLGSMNTGLVAGPMVALGDEKRVALALQHCNPEFGRGISRLTLVDVEEATPKPAFNSQAMDCVRGNTDIPADGIFNKGLVLLAAKTPTDKWRLVAPVNTPKGSRMVAYTPDGTTAQERCIIASGGPDQSCLLTPVLGLSYTNIAPPLKVYQASNTLFSIHTSAPQPGLEKYRYQDLYLRNWKFDAANSLWQNAWEKWDFGGGVGESLFSYAQLNNLSGGLAVSFHDHEKDPDFQWPVPARSLWISGDGLQRVRWHDHMLRATGDRDNLLMGKLWRTSPVALDTEGHAYAVVRTGDNSYTLMRFLGDSEPQLDARHKCLVGNDIMCSKSWHFCMGLESREPGADGLCVPRPDSHSFPFEDAPVGSPLLGEPLGDAPAEVYVVTTTGTVRAFRTGPQRPKYEYLALYPPIDRLALLWEENLGVRISPTAQPVLKGDTLWVVGIRGEVRGIQVDSNGLSRTAHWPKAFRDNCNTSSYSADIPSCFGNEGPEEAPKH